MVWKQVGKVIGTQAALGAKWRLGGVRKQRVFGAVL